MSRVITVFGATGAQGGSLARAALNDPRHGFRVRAVTRRPDAEAALALAHAGAEIVYADLDNPDSLRRAMRGADGAYCVTNFWEHCSADRELQQARNLAVAARDAQVAHVVWSTLEDTREFVTPGSGVLPLLQGRYNVPHYDA